MSSMARGHSMPLIRVAIADDHPVVVLGIRKMLDREDGIHVVATAGTVDAVIEGLDATDCDVLVCDYAFHGADDGLRLLERLRTRYPRLRIILLTMHDDTALIRRVLSIGVAGFFGKSSASLDALPNAIRAVYAGATYLDPATAEKLESTAQGRAPGQHTYTPPILTRAEFEVVRQLVKGMSVTEIAQETHRSIKTISTQKMRAMDKLGARNDVELGDRFRRIAEDPGPGSEETDPAAS
ncbi:response regulator transcription factor [Burkholderia cepacia]|uniref:response regulator transcription factor n=1 Tax=Burkholderia cepacia TaxID=292 RepID=UPI002ABDAE84|nr:response regulator transcription factor [Burkholderia cepacia]